MSDSSLHSFYVLNWNLMQHHKYSLAEIEDMLPFERDIYVALLNSYIEEQNKLHQRQQFGNR